MKLVNAYPEHTVGDRAEAFSLSLSTADLACFFTTFLLSVSVSNFRYFFFSHFLLETFPVPSIIRARTPTTRTRSFFVVVLLFVGRDDSREANETRREPC